jgi:hypothetical protein
MTVNARLASLGEASATVQVTSGTTRADLHLECRPKITRSSARHVIP